jgi:hypothetical protein
MMEQQFSLKFTWNRPEKGYIWKDCKAFSGNFYTETPIPGGPYLVERDYSQSFYPWSPLDDAATFARFADVQPNDDALSAWASENGRLVATEKLSDGSSLFVLPDNSTGMTKKPIHHTGITRQQDGVTFYAQEGESRQFWYKEHFALSFATMVWELTVNNDVDSLKKIVIWQGEKRVSIMKFLRDTLSSIHTCEDGAISYPFDEKKNSLDYELLFDADINMRSWVPQRFPHPDIINPAKLFVQVEVNKKLLEYPLQVALTLNERGELEKRLYPTSLLSAMWYQLYLALSGETKLRRCVICGQWEDMSGHRVNWSKHKKCISYKRLEKYNLSHEKRIDTE